MKRLPALALVIALSTVTPGAQALEYGSVGAASAVLYDAPSIKGKKLYVVSRYMPLEVVVSLNDWVKVRAQDGSLAWIEKRALGSVRYVVVTASLADIRQSPDRNAALVFQARKQVALELLQDTNTGWLKIRHPDGETGYIRARDVWGG